MLKHFQIVMLALLPVVAGAQAMNSPKAECEQLLDALLPFAEKMLREHGEFYPYGGTMDHSGKINHAAADDGTSHPPSSALIELLRNGFVSGAANGTYKATALVYDVRVIPPGRESKTDAIAVELDHRDDYSVVVYFPYKFERGEVTLEAPFAQEGDDRVFQ
jgi:hypothetical protein